MFSYHDQAKALVAARRSQDLLPRFPGSVPENLGQAYRIQDEAIELWDEGVPHGWKVGLISPPVRRNGVSRFVGPFWGPQLSGSPVEVHGGALSVEVEIVLLVDGAILDTATPLSQEAVQSHVTAVHLGLEIVGSPVNRLASYGTACLVADFGNSTAVVLGPPIGIDAIETLSVSLDMDDVRVQIGGSADLQGGVLLAAAEGIGILRQRNIPLAPQFWLATGTMTGAYPVKRGQTVDARAKDGTRVSCTIVAPSCPP